jgi:hypothetical protein
VITLLLNWLQDLGGKVLSGPENEDQILFSLRLDRGFVAGQALIYKDLNYLSVLGF